jgi:hypothetical protein
MKYLHRAIICNVLGVIQILLLFFGGYMIFYIIEDVIAKFIGYAAFLFTAYSMDHPFFMPFKEPPEIISIEVSVGGKQNESN